jgi:hypothetical protein
MNCNLYLIYIYLIYIYLIYIYLIYIGLRADRHKYVDLLLLWK